jgi:hypothetical protein
MTQQQVEVSAPHQAVSVIAPVGDHPRDAPSLLAKLAVMEPRYRCSLEATLSGKQSTLDLLPSGSDVVREHRSDFISRTWATCGDIAYLVEERPADAEVVTFAASVAKAVAAMADVRTRCRVTVDDDVHALLWLLGSRGPTIVARRLQTPCLGELLENYPRHVGRALEALAATSSPDGSARLLLWHGPPGTGKTRAVLALLHAWRSWCQADVITDPERMFSDASYLVEVLTRPTPADKWKLVVCEDADEYLRSDARARSGPGLGRLLNASDGLLGRGSKALILLTTNDDLGRLHPAVTRPGRCMSLLEFAPFTAAEATEWLQRPVQSPLTLAELYQARQSDTTIPVAPAPLTGAYL